VRDDLEGILRDATLTVIAFAIALGWSLYQLAHGIAVFVDGLLTHLPVGDGQYFGSGAGGLTWVVGRRLVTLDQMAVGLIELALVLAAAAFVRRYAARA
jgi:hypothetical protein